MENLLTASGTQLAEWIRTQKVSSLEVVNAHIAHIQKVNPHLNAMVQDRFALARQEAKEADQTIREKELQNLPLFFGVPCTIKESFSIEGMPNSSGLLARKHVISETNAPTVDRLLEAGAIPLGVTNISELCMWLESNNRVYGRSNNPYNQTRIVGGSSGGEGAIIGAGGSPFGLGSDIGGSIRMPAFFNGIFGHKPTGGLVTNEGQYPIAENEALRYQTTGPLARRAEDLAPLLKIFMGDTSESEYDFDPNLISKVDISSLNVLDVPGNFRMRVSRDLRKAQSNCHHFLKTRGAKVSKQKIDRLKHSFEIWASMLDAVEQTPFATMLGNGKPVKALWELMRIPRPFSPYTLPALALSLLEKIPSVALERYIEIGKHLKQELIDLIGPNGVMLYPSYTSPAPKHYSPMLRPFDWVYTGIINVLEFPSTQVPLGLNHEGLPLGVQIVSIPGNDHLTIAVAIELEKQFGGWVPPWKAKAA